MLIMIHTINHGEHFRDFRQSGYDIGRGDRGIFKRALKILSDLKLYILFISWYFVPFFLFSVKLQKKSSKFFDIIWVRRTRC